MQESRGVAAVRALRWSLWVLGALIAVLLITWAILQVRAADPVEPTLSRTERIQLDAEERYRALADDARSMTGSPAADDPALAARLGDLAADLEDQADAVALPRPVEESSPSATDIPRTTAPAAPLPSAADVLQRLTDSALMSLLAAVDAEPGPARVLASTGVNQWRHSTLLAEALGAAPPLAPDGVFPATDLSTGSGIFTGAAVRLRAHREEQAEDHASAPADSPRTDGTDGSSPRCPGAPSGTDADRDTLLAARLAEEEARYAYEVAAARLPGERSELLERSAGHAATAEDAGRRLAALCAPVDPVPPGFALDAAFGANPTAALGQLEQQHVDLYAGSVPSAGPETRAWVIAEFSVSAQRDVATGSSLPTFPGLGVPAPQASDGGAAGG